MNAIWARVQDEPTMTYGMVQAAIIVGTAFGLGWSGQQVGAVCAFTAVFLSWLTRRQVRAIAPIQYPETETPA